MQSRFRRLTRKECKVIKIDIGARIEKVELVVGRVWNCGLANRGLPIGIWAADAKVVIAQCQGERVGGIVSWHSGVQWGHGKAVRGSGKACHGAGDQNWASQ